jgi:hypothetical protein
MIDQGYPPGDPVFFQDTGGSDIPENGVDALNAACDLHAAYSSTLPRLIYMVTDNNNYSHNVQSPSAVNARLISNNIWATWLDFDSNAISGQPHYSDIFIQNLDPPGAISWTALPGAARMARLDELASVEPFDEIGPPGGGGHPPPVIGLDTWYGWMVSNGIGDPGYGGNNQEAFGFHGRFPYMAAAGNFWMWDTGVFSYMGGGVFQMVAQVSADAPYNTDSSGYWEDGSIAIYEPYLAFTGGHQTAGGWTRQSRRGQLWDAVIVAAPFPSETIITLDDKRWRNITHGGGHGSPPALQVPHSIFLLTN